MHAQIRFPRLLLTRRDTGMLMQHSSLGQTASQGAVSAGLCHTPAGLLGHAIGFHPSFLLRRASLRLPPLPSCGLERANAAAGRAGAVMRHFSGRGSHDATHRISGVQGVITVAAAAAVLLNAPAQLQAAMMRHFSGRGSSGAFCAVSLVCRLWSQSPRPPPYL